MGDPFRPQTNNQLLREARIGLTVLAITLGIFCYVAYLRISGSGTQIPEHVLNAPIANSVWPGEDPTAIAKATQTPSVSSQFGSMIANARKTFGMDLDRKQAKRQTTDNRSSEPRQSRLPNRLTSGQKPGSKLLANRSAYVDPTSKESDATSFEPQIPNRVEPGEFDLARFQKTADAADKALAELKQSTAQLDRLPLDVNELRSNQTSKPDLVSAAPKDYMVKPATHQEPIVAANQNSEFESSETSSTSFRSLANSKQANSNPARANRPNAALRSASSPLVENEFSPNRPRPTVTGDVARATRPFPTPAAADFATVNSEDKSKQSPSIIQPLSPTSNAAVSAHPNNEPSRVRSTAESESTSTSSRRYTVMAGDSFWSIAQKSYEDGRYYRALFEYNRKIVGTYENLGPGTEILTPPSDELVRMWPELCPKPDNSAAAITDVDQRIYTTKSGDTLFEIARQRLGQASEYLEIMKANSTRLKSDVTHLTPLPAGIQLVIPLQSG